ncbi:hypothetical protein PC116_g24172 [Phytophthora cactorum]|nr:hypothetical protein PC114_g22090 [Phytophthora cactorum]KAG3148079.1 hypothetical protein PC128_g23675 [Phytophthora cactorum]KAG4227434.1 hypothetical protein PC116_g24172 [Phytophthora cactorum]
MAAFSMPTRMDMCAASYGLLVMYKYAAALPAAVVAIRAQIFRCHPGSAAWDRRVNGEVDGRRLHHDHLLLYGKETSMPPSDRSASAGSMY